MVTPVNLSITKGNLNWSPLNEGQVSLPYIADFSGVSEIEFQMTQVQQKKEFSVCESMFIDNTTNPSPVFVQVSSTGQTFPVPPYSAGYYVVTAQPDSTITVTTVGGATAPCFINFYNYRIEPIVWTGFAPLIDGATVRVIGQDNLTPMTPSNPLDVAPAIATPTFATINVADGVSTQLLAASASPKGFEARNIGDWPVFVRVNAAAVLNQGILLNPGDKYSLPYRTTQVINALASGGACDLLIHSWI